MAVHDRGVEPVRDAGDAQGSIGQQAEDSRSVGASVTYTHADARAILLMGVPRYLPVVYVAAAGLALLSTVTSWAAGEGLSGQLLSVVGLGFFFGLLYLVVLPRQIVRAGSPGQSWVVSAQGVHISLPGADGRHDWSRFDQVVMRPAVIQFRMGRCSLSLPRRCVTDEGRKTIEALAAGGGVTVRRRGQFR